MQLVFINALADRDEAFNDWYDNVHVRDAMRFPGAVSSQRYAAHQREDGGAGFDYLTIYESSDPERSAQARRDHAGTPRMMIADVCDKVNIVNNSFYPLASQTRQPTQTYPDQADLLVEVMHCTDEDAPAIEAYYADHRIPAMMAATGVVAGQLLRWEAYGQASSKAPRFTHVAMFWFTGANRGAIAADGSVPALAGCKDFRTASYTPLGDRLTAHDVLHPDDAARDREERARQRFSAEALGQEALRDAFGGPAATVAPSGPGGAPSEPRRTSVTDINQLEEAPTQSVEEERERRKQRLAGAYRIFSMKGFDNGLAGHITVRDPEFADRFWVAPLGLWFGAMRPDDLVEVDHDGRILSGKGVINSAGFAIHSAIHKARPDVVCAAHSHSVHGKAWSTHGRLLDPITQDVTFFYNNHVVVEDFSGVVLAAEEGERIARTLGGARAAILQSHGILTVGRSVESAVANYVALENACQVQLLAEMAGQPAILPHAVASKTDNQKPDHDPGKFAFAPLWQQMLRTNPDFPAAR